MARYLMHRVAWIAGKPAPTGLVSTKHSRHAYALVGAGLLAMAPV